MCVYQQLKKKAKNLKEQFVCVGEGVAWKVWMEIREGVNNIIEL